MTPWLASLLGAALGGVITWLVVVPRLRDRLIAAQAEAGLLQQRIVDLEGAAAQDRELAATLSPLAGSLQRVESQVASLERDRVAQFARLDEQLHAVRAQATALAGALRAPTSRGSWGEVQLRRVVEHAGMLDRVDFDVQVSATGPDGERVRPDLVVHLPGGKHVVVDAKAPLAAFLTASEAPDDDRAPWESQARREKARVGHARALRAHVDALAAKEYWRAFDPSPELVVCFVPGESFLSEACAADPALLEYAMSRRVVLATPTTLMSLLRTVALTWQSDALSGSAKEIFDLGRELYSRLGVLGSHTARLGRSLERAAEDYNALIGTLERRVLVTARKMHDLELVEEPLDVPAPLTLSHRPIAAPELLEHYDLPRSLDSEPRPAAPRPFDLGVRDRPAG